MKLRSLLLFGACLAFPAISQATMYRSDYDGEFGILNPDTAAFTVLNTLPSGQPLSGICLDNQGRMWGTERITNSTTNLIEINPQTGAVIATVGSITVDSSNLKITDLACQPGTGTLFGLDNNSPARLLTINKTTADATLIGTTTVSRGGLGFAPDGRLFAASIDRELARIDPATGQTIGAELDTDECIDGFAVAPGGNLGYGTECDGDELYRIDLATGASQTIGNMGSYGADVAFAPDASAAPAASHLTLGLMALMLGGIAVRRLVRKEAA